MFDPILVPFFQHNASDRLASPPIIIEDHGGIAPRRGYEGYVEAPATSFDMPSERPRGRHTIETVSAFNSYMYRCSCGWEVSAAYLEGLGNNDIRALLVAHMAGGDVGPRKSVVREHYEKAKAAMPSPYIVPCCNCHLTIKDIFARLRARVVTTPLDDSFMFCCDGQLILIPRRRFILEDE